MNFQDASNLRIPEGDVRTIHDKDSHLLWGSVGYDVSFDGNATQSASPNPDYPQDINIVTGTQTIDINGTSYPINLGDIELAKIGTYQDRIHKSGTKWYIEKQIGKVVLDGTEAGLAMYNTNRFRVPVADIVLQTSGTPVTMSDYFVGSSYTAVSAGSAENIMSGYYGAHQIRLYSTKWASLADFTTWLASNPTTVYYALATPTTTEITDATLIAQLEAVYDWVRRHGYSAQVSGDLPIIINRTALPTV